MELNQVVCKTIGLMLEQMHSLMKRKGSDVVTVCTIKINEVQFNHEDPGLLVNMDGFREKHTLYKISSTRNRPYSTAIMNKLLRDLHVT